jgi:FAD/FMN-containing dehydrogenase
VSDPLLARLRDVVGAAQVLTDPDVLATYGTDWTRRFHGAPRFVVRPGGTAELAAVLAECHAAGVPVVPQGGNTSLVGGATPAAGEAVLSLARLDDLGEIDVVAGDVLAGAGVTLARLQETARAHGLRFGVDLASRDSATLGGMAATNAGGIHVLRHGMMRAQVAGIEAVLADGSVLSRLSLAGKDNTGYDLASLLVGSEGTLAVISRLRLRLVPDPPHRAVALAGFATLADLLATVAHVRDALPSLEAAALVREHTGVGAPLQGDWPLYVLFEAAGREPQELLLAEAVLDAPVPPGDAVVAADGPTQARLWAYRERHTESVNAAGVPHKFDVAVPLGALAEFVAKVEPGIRAHAPAARVITFGHVAEGNLHVNVLGVPDEAEHAVAESVLGLVAGLGGSISAEHGIGLAKRDWLHLTRPPADIAAMRALKAALDGRGILNPNVLFPAPG